jgi:AbrB family looped-hinge helix DNA binding protein
MSTVTLSSKFQFVLPKEFRKKLGLKVGSTIDISMSGEKIEIRRVRHPSELMGTLPGLPDFVREKDREL